MLKDVIKQLIVLHQNNIPFSLNEREAMLPLDAGQIITIPGVRRSGKSSKMKLVINELVKTGVPPQNILWMGFDDERLAGMSRQELNEILDAYRELYPDTPLRDVYMFFDEIQDIEGWELFVMRIYKSYCQNIYISISWICFHIVFFCFQRTIWRIYIKHIMYALGFKIVSCICIQTLVTLYGVCTSPPEPTSCILMEWTEDYWYIVIL